MSAKEVREQFQAISARRCTFGAVFALYVVRNTVALGAGLRDTS